MKTKNKILLIIATALMCALIILVVILVERMGQNKTNEINVKEAKYKDLENILPNDYDLRKIVEDKCYIEMDNGVVYNANQVEDFIKNVKENKPNEVRIVKDTDEGQRIITDLKYTKHKFIMKSNTRGEHWSAQNDKVIRTIEYDADKIMLTIDGKELSQIDVKMFEENGIGRKNYQVNLVSKTEKLDVFSFNYVKIKRKKEDFQIVFNKNNKDNKDKAAILKKGENDKYDYDIYSYCGTVDIIIDGKQMSLREALINNKITMSDILEKAEKDKADKFIWGDFYLDGGSAVYLYNDYSIIKLNTLDGNKDCYIGNISMDIGEIKKK